MDDLAFLIATCKMTATLTSLQTVCLWVSTIFICAVAIATY